MSWWKICSATSLLRSKISCNWSAKRLRRGGSADSKITLGNSLIFVKTTMGTMLPIVDGGASSIIGKLTCSPVTRVGETPPSRRGKLRIEPCRYEESINWEAWGELGGIKGNSSSMMTRILFVVSLLWTVEGEALEGEPRETGPFKWGLTDEGDWPN